MRLDKYILEKHPELTRSKIQDLIKLNKVIVNGVIVNKTGYDVDNNDQVEINNIFKYVSRGGMKLENAIDHLHLSLNDLVIMDVGSSTGGFSDCALQHGAKLVYAYDVGYQQMADSIKNDQRVILNEKTNILNIVPPVVDLVMVDVSFTSIKPIINHLYNASDQFLLLIKPQFEVGKMYIKKGLVKDKKRVQFVLNEFKQIAHSLYFNDIEIFPTNFPGKDGNLEYWLYLKK